MCYGADMTARHPFPPKSTGRLPYGRDPVVPVRIPPALLVAIDNWTAGQGKGGRMNKHAKKGPQAASRSDAIRKLIIKGLGRAGVYAMQKAQQEHREKRGEVYLDRHEGMRELWDKLIASRKLG
jgi:hypothetical protein